MILKIDDWKFDIDLEKTRDHSSYAFSSHCTCGYCENYYRAVNQQYPDLCDFLLRFGLEIEGPSEMYPFEPTLCLVGYKVMGRILRAGAAPMMVNGLPIMPQLRDEHHFLLEVGEIPLLWVLDDDMDEVISPANEPEFLERMYRKMIERSSGSMICS